MKATKSGSFKAVPLPEPQTVFARCYSVLDIGTVPNTYKGEVKAPTRKVFITWELPELLAVFNEEKGEQPFIISKELTLSTGDNSNLSKLIAQWRGKPLTPKEQEGFDPMVMIGKEGLIAFGHRRRSKFKGAEIDQVTNENTDLDFISIMKPPKSMDPKTFPKQLNPMLKWDWDLVEEKGFDKEAFELIPKWLRKKMSESAEFKKFAPKGYTIDSTTTASDAEETTQEDAAPVQEKISEEGW